MDNQIIKLYEPRKQFIPFHERTQRWAVLVCHRRAGKTVACIAELIARALSTPGGRFGYIAPTYRQAKDVAWDYVKERAHPFLEGKPNESEPRVDLKNGSRIRLYGADNAEGLRGIYLHGLVLDEYGLFKPDVWGAILRPTLADHEGWAVFIGTPAGRVGLYDIWAGINQWKDVDAFRLMLKASETKILPDTEMRDMKRTMSPEQYQQEAECSFDASVMGAYYGRCVAEAEKDKRICGVPYDPAALVFTAWDIGIGDPTAIWFAQIVGREVHLIDYYENRGESAAHYAGIIRSKPYAYVGHILPHDAAPKELTSGKNVPQILGELGLSNVRVLEVHAVDAGIEGVRMMFPKCWFDAKKCEKGIDALRLYRADYDEKRLTLKNKPLHDWTSHAADAFRYLAMGQGLVTNRPFSRPIVFPKIGIA